MKVIFTHSVLLVVAAVFLQYCYTYLPSEMMIV